MHYFTTTIEDDNANDILVNVTYSWEAQIDNQGREYYGAEVHSVCDAEGNAVKLPKDIYDLCEQDYIDSADERRLSVSQFQEFLMQ